MWVPADWVAAGVTGLPDTDVEIVALGRDVGQTGDIGAVPIPASAADVEFYVPSFFPSRVSIAALAQMPRWSGGWPRGEPLRNVISDAY